MNLYSSVKARKIPFYEKILSQCVGEKEEEAYGSLEADACHHLASDASAVYTATIGCWKIVRGMEFARTLHLGVISTRHVLCLIGVAADT